MRKDLEINLFPNPVSLSPFIDSPYECIARFSVAAKQASFIASV